MKRTAPNTCNRGKLRLLATIGRTVCALGFVIYLIVAAGGLIGLSNVLDDHYETTDIAEYGQYSGRFKREEEALYGRTRLSIFPAAITSAHTVHSYYYYGSGADMENSYRIILDYSLPQAEFEAEAARLAGLAGAEPGQIGVVYDESSFALPAYVAAFRRNAGSSDYGSFEYALVDALNGRIVCVLLIEGHQSALPIDAELLPPRYLSYAEGALGFSVYESQ